MPESATSPGVRVLRVPDGPGGRVDRYVADATGLSRSYVQKLISDGRLTAAGEALRANTIVGAGTELRLDVPEAVPLELAPAPEIGLRIVYELGGVQYFQDLRDGLVLQVVQGAAPDVSQAQATCIAGG